MLKDIEFPEIKDVHIALVEEKEASLWSVHIINNSNEPIENTMLSSKGYGEVDGRQKTTSAIRQVVGTVPAKSSQPVESLTKELLQLTNEFWLSFFKNNQLYDKKFVFTPGSIAQVNLTELPVIHGKGILHT